MSSTWGHEVPNPTEADIVDVLQGECSCGGAGPDDPLACTACRIYHMLFNPTAWTEGQKAVREYKARAHPKLLPQDKPASRGEGA